MLLAFASLAAGQSQMLQTLVEYWPHSAPAVSKAEAGQK
jgi:hypothetical protein